MDTNGHEWTRMDTNGHEWTRMNTNEYELMEKLQQGEESTALGFKSGCKCHILCAKRENTSDARKRTKPFLGEILHPVSFLVKNHPCPSVFICGSKGFF